METITFNCELITPLFMSGADGTTPELRAPSIKGALRFWWRAMNGHLSIGTLQKEETNIFGGVLNDSSQKSKVIIRVDCDEFTPSFDMPTYSVDTYKKKYKNINILFYLAYGHTEYKKIDNRGRTVLAHSFIPPKTKFRVTFLMPENYKEEVVKAFMCLSMFGGLGSKSRNGFGSFNIVSIFGADKNKIALPNVDFDNLKTNNLCSYSAFSINSELYETIEEDYDNGDEWDGYRDWVGALGAVGASYQYARECLDNPHHTYDKRLYVAQPIEVRNHQIPNFLQRHSKPFFINIYKLSNNKYKARILYLPYKYLENNSDFSNNEIAKHQTNYLNEVSEFCRLFLKNEYFIKK